jgi:copper(I)-binding protein
MAAYMIIDNQTSETITSSKIIANGFEKTEIHTSYVVDEISKMKKLNNLSIKGSESLVMEPGGLHLMLINPDGVPKRNSNVEILMFFKNASTSKVVRIEAEVRDQTS